MPVEALAALVVDQALGIVVGAAVVVVAPAVVSNLRAPDQGASGTIAITEKALQAGGGAVQAKVRGIAVVSTVPAAATGSVTKTGHVIYLKVADGARWYSGKLTDLVAEAQAARAARYADAMTLAGVLASLPKARVVSDIPGRARLRVKYLKGRASKAQYTADALVTAPGISQVKANSHTGSLLIYYDTRQYSSLDALLEWIVTE